MEDEFIHINTERITDNDFSLIHTINNDELLNFIDIGPDELIRQINVDLHRCGIILDKIKPAEPYELMDYINSHPYLRVNKHLVIIACTQLVMLLPCKILTDLISDDLSITDISKNNQLNIIVDPDIINVNKKLKAITVDKYGDDHTKYIFKIEIDIDLFSDETIIYINKII